MTRLEALEITRKKAGTLEDFLQGDGEDKAVNIIDPRCGNEVISSAVDGLQKLIKWTAEEIRLEALKEDDLNNPDLYSNDEVFEEEKITTLDDELRDRGLTRGMF